MKLGLLTAITQCASQPVILERRILRGHPSQPSGSKRQATSIFEGLIRECNPREASGGGRGVRCGVRDRVASMQPPLCSKLTFTALCSLLGTALMILHVITPLVLAATL